MAKVAKKKKRKLGEFRSSGGGSGDSGLRPKLIESLPPCMDRCPNHNAIREMLMTISKAEEFEKSYDQAFEEAFHIFLETTPFPSTCGRVCPHPCETGCNRKEKEGSVGINNVERFIGDFGLEKGLKPTKLAGEARSEKIAVVGSGPGGLTAAYQLARRGYPVTVFEAFPKAGGMLRYGIPDYRLPPKVLDAEIDRILELGVELKLNTAVGERTSPSTICARSTRRSSSPSGRTTGIELRIEGEDAPNVFTGTDFLHRVNVGREGRHRRQGAGDRRRRHGHRRSARLPPAGRGGRDRLPADPHGDAGHRRGDRGRRSRGRPHRLPGRAHRDLHGERQGDRHEVPAHGAG